MKIKAKNFKIKEERGDFIAVFYDKHFKFNIEDFLDLFNEMKKKGYRFLMEVEWKYLLFEGIKK